MGYIFVTCLATAGWKSNQDASNSIKTWYRGFPTKEGLSWGSNCFLCLEAVKFWSTLRICSEQFPNIKYTIYWTDNGQGEGKLAAGWTSFEALWLWRGDSSTMTIRLLCRLSQLGVIYLFFLLALFMIEVMSEGRISSVISEVSPQNFVCPLYYCIDVHLLYHETDVSNRKKHSSGLYHWMVESQVSTSSWSEAILLRDKTQGEEKRKYWGTYSLMGHFAWEKCKSFWICSSTCRRRLWWYKT